MAASKIVLALLLSSFVIGTFASICKIPESKITFIKWDRFQGDWYQKSSFGDWIGNLFFKCHADEYTVASSISLLKDSNSVFKWPTIKSHTQYNIKIGNLASFVESKISWLPISKEVTVLDTDYTNYAILYSCTNYLLFTKSSSWILSRVRDGEFNAEVQQKIDAALSGAGLSSSDYHKVQQTGC